MNSLAPGNSSYDGSGSILAATKIAHEFGHVNRMTKTNPEIYRLQTQLIPLYNSILLSNGRNTHDPRLIELAQKMGGTPVEIWEDREYWGEVGAMLFLRDITARQNYQCALFNRSGSLWNCTRNPIGTALPKLPTPPRRLTPAPGNSGICLNDLKPLCNLCELCASVVNLTGKHSPQRRRAH